MIPVGAVSGVTGVSGPGSLGDVLAAGAVPPDGVARGADPAAFAAALTDGLQNVQALQGNADTLAVQAATGDLTDVHDYMLAATQARVATELTVAVRNKAVEAFTEIMRMQA
jgi:flagellar hook-basal body complex protein FliE